MTMEHLQVLCAFKIHITDTFFFSQKQFRPLNIFLLHTSIFSISTCLSTPSSNHISLLHTQASPRGLWRTHGGRGWSRKGQEPVWGRFFRYFRFWRPLRIDNILSKFSKISIQLASMDLAQEGGLPRSLVGSAYRGSKISIFSIFPIENIEKIKAHRKKKFNGQDWQKRPLSEITTRLY